MPPKRDTAAALDAILERVPRMRALGVLSIHHDGFAMSLAPIDAVAETTAGLMTTATPDEDDKPPEHEADPLNDRATYAGGRVPGFTRPKKETT